MPVLGHAFVGLAIGMSSTPAARGGSRADRVKSRSALWLAVVVTLAYLPDIVAQIGLLLGWSNSRLLGHCVLFALAVSPVVAALLWRAAAVPFVRAFVTSLISLLVHDGLDLAQTTDRAPWWPLSNRTVGFDLALVPTDLVREGIVFGGLFVAVLALRQASRRRSGLVGLARSRVHHRRRPCRSCNASESGRARVPVRDRPRPHRTGSVWRWARCARTS
jgi:membrane-bound metal-dependent hydrolase YbcI (DUF457 family)